MNALKCTDCGRPATHYVAVTMHGQIYNMPFCDECAKRYENHNVYETFMAPEPQCPICGTKLSDVLESQYVGCSECYNLFRPEVLEKIYKMYGTKRHLGKRLKQRANKRVELDDDENMREQYHLAMEEGRFDDAEEILSYLKGGNANG